jgi:hypothetical protein
MKLAYIFPVPVISAHGFMWKWRSEDGAAESKAFVYFYECGLDAQRRGYRARFAETPERSLAAAQQPKPGFAPDAALEDVPAVL